MLARAPDEVVTDVPPGVGIQPELLADAGAAEPRRRRRLIRLLRGRPGMKVTVDAAMLVAAAFVAVWSFDLADVPTMHIRWLALYPVLTLALFWLRRMYTPRLRVQLLDELREVVFVTASAAMFTFAIRGLLYDDRFLAAQGLRQWLFAAILLAAGRICLAQLDRRRWKRGRELKRTLIIGTGSVGELVAKRLIKHPEWGLLPVAFLDPALPKPSASHAGAIPILDASWPLERAVRELRVRHVIVAFSRAPYDTLLRLTKRCEELGLMVSVVPRLLERVTGQLTVDHIGGLPLLSTVRVDPRGWQFAVKYAADRVVAAIALVLFLPIFLLVGLAVYLSVGRPMIYRQPRVGRDGKPFELLKLRTMRPASVAPDGVSPDELQETDGDRLTRVGRFLRTTSLDELPQLINVLRGEMSLVGPRPERPEFSVTFEQFIHRYRERYRVKSGITGWAQVHGIGRGNDRFTEISLADRAELDNHYIENWSLWLDIKILLMTLSAVLHFRQRAHVPPESHDQPSDTQMSEQLVPDEARVASGQ